MPNGCLEKLHKGVTLFYPSARRHYEGLFHQPSSKDGHEMQFDFIDFHDTVGLFNKKLAAVIASIVFFGSLFIPSVRTWLLNQAIHHAQARIAPMSKAFLETIQRQQHPIR